MTTTNEQATKETLELLAFQHDIQRQLEWQLLCMNSVPTEIRVKLNLKNVALCLINAIDAIDAIGKEDDRAK